MKSILRAALFLFLLAPAAAQAQSFDVNPPFDAAGYKPLAPHERMQRWWREDGASPAIHVESFSTALYQQVFNIPTKWQGGGGGFIRRVGSSYGGNLIQNSTHELLAGVEGTDPRYFACGCKGFIRRSGHALKMTFLTYNHSGHETLDLPQLSAAYGSSIVEDTWWPHHYSAWVQGVQSGHIDVGIIAAEHLIQEFSPEFKRFLHLPNRTAPSKP
ncbi:MAG: hypothetical protein ABR987_08750 [Terracidiphilus sp.]